jgi:hypothetical protein
MAGQASIENGKLGGRPKGSLNKATIEKKEAQRQFIDRVVKNVDRLFNAQISLAEGCSYLYRIEDEGEGKNKKRKHVLVTSPEEIQAYLDDDVDQDNYYYITTHTPDNKAIDSLMDRAFGKARQTIGLDGGEEGKPIPILATMNVPTHDSNQENSQPQETDQGGSGRDISQQDYLDTPVADSSSAVGPDTNPDERGIGVNAPPEAGSDEGLPDNPEGSQLLQGSPVE